jgi:chemotaxis protein MotB
MDRRIILLPALVAMSLVACVPARQLQDANAKKDMLDAENRQLKDRVQSLESELGETKTRNTELEQDNQKLIADTTEFGINFRQIRDRYDKLNELNEMLSSKNVKLLNEAAEENRKLLEELETTRLALQKKEDELDKKESDLNSLSTDLDTKGQRIQEMEELLARQEGALNTLREKVSKALLGFEGKGLTVEQKNGKVYVSMESKLLFPSGSTAIDPEGKKALIELAKAIQDQAELEIIVEGHTDTDQIRSANIPRDNWELSVLRATAVVKIMTENSGIDPTRLSASGRSEYLPIDPADKAKNRRTEIILSPKLDELFEVIEQK